MHFIKSLENLIISLGLFITSPSVNLNLNAAEKQLNTNIVPIAKSIELYFNSDLGHQVPLNVNPSKIIISDEEEITNPIKLNAIKDNSSNNTWTYFLINPLRENNENGSKEYSSEMFIVNYNINSKSELALLTISKNDRVDKGLKTDQEYLNNLSSFALTSVSNITFSGISSILYENLNGVDPNAVSYCIDAVNRTHWYSIKFTATGGFTPKLKEDLDKVIKGLKLKD